MMNLLSGGAVVAALAIVALWAKLRRRQCRVADGLKALRGKVVLVTGASSGLGEGD